MKIYTVLILSCISVLGADTDIRVTTSTSSIGSLILKTDVFTRNGQTNLVCFMTTKKDGTVVNRVHSFYQGGLLVAESSWAIVAPDFHSFSTEADSPYSVGLSYGSPNGEGVVQIQAKDGRLVDVFTCTNGVYYPVEIQKIQMLNQKTRELNDEKMKAKEQAPDTVK